MILDPSSDGPLVEVGTNITEEEIEQLAYSIGRPFKYYKYTYFYQNEKVIPVAFESINAEIKFWHVIDRLKPDYGFH